MIITLGGLSGAGKTTVKNLLAQRLGWTSYSMGDMRGKYAIDQGITIDELNERGLHDPTSDQLVDAFQEKLGKTEDQFVIDGWMSWHFIPQSLKIFLTIDPGEGARRIFLERQHYPDARLDEKAFASIAETQEQLAKRVKNNQERLKHWYGVDFLDLSQYDLVIDTTHLQPTEVADRILAKIA